MNIASSLRRYRSTLIAVAIGAHFTLAALGMLRLWLPLPMAARFQYFYGRLTGCGGTFGFFSPNAPREFLIDFDLEDSSGHHQLRRLQDQVPSELQARLINMTSLLGRKFENERVTRAIAASLVASVFRQHPEMRAITLRAHFVDFPSLQTYQTGERPSLIEIYRARFQPGRTK